MKKSGVKVRVNKYCYFCQRMGDRMYRYPGNRHWYCSKECYDNDVASGQKGVEGWAGILR